MFMTLIVSTRSSLDVVEEPLHLDPQAHAHDVPGQAEILAGEIDEIRAELSKMDAADFKNARNCSVIGSPPKPILADRDQRDLRRKLRERERLLLLELNEQMDQEGRGRYW